MYGLVNQGVQDLAVQLGGETLWNEIRTAAGVDVTFGAAGRGSGAASGSALRHRPRAALFLTS
ncbi:MAG: hypothetical protein ABIM89_11740 [Mycobacteriales bacterium]